MATIEHLSASATGAEGAAVLARDGVVVIDELVAPSVMDAVRSELAPYLDATRTVLKDATSFQLHLTQVIEIGPASPRRRSTATSGRSTSSRSRAATTSTCATRSSC